MSDGVHDLHASAVATNLPVLTAHVVVDDSCFHDRHLPGLLDQLQQCLAGHFDVEHSTFQFERAQPRRPRTRRAPRAWRSPWASSSQAARMLRLRPLARPVGRPGPGGPGRG